MPDGVKTRPTFRRNSRMIDQDSSANGNDASIRASRCSCPGRCAVRAVPNGSRRSPSVWPPFSRRSPQSVYRSGLPIGVSPRPTPRRRPWTWPPVFASQRLGRAGEKIRVVIRDGWSEPVNLFGVVVLPPGERKSIVFEDVLAPATEFERQEVERMAPIIAKLACDHRVLEERLETRRRQ